MKQVKIYSKNYCPYCQRAKALFDQKGVTYTEINLEGKRDELMALIKETGMRTVPQIYIGDEFIGGFSELSELDKKGLLDSKLG